MDVPDPPYVPPLAGQVGDLPKQVRPSVPEPLPKPNGVPVTPELLKYIDSLQVRLGTEVCDQTATLIKERDAYGFAKYGQHLMSCDGRDSIEDARQELGDLLQYLYKAKMNGEDIEIFRQHFLVLECLVLD